MHTVTNTHDPAHRVAFGSREAAEGFIAAASDPTAWTLDATASAGTGVPAPNASE